MVKVTCENDRTIIALSGRIDSSNAPETERKAENSGYVGGDVVVDAAELEYISSAGLRILMKLKKNSKKFQIINVSSAIFDILYVTGFTDIMDVKRARRKISLGECEPLAANETPLIGKIYRIDRDTVLKTYPSSITAENLEERDAKSKAAFMAEVPIILSYDVVETDEGFGRLYGMDNAKTLADILKEDPLKVSECADKFSDLLKTIHNADILCKMPLAKDIYKAYAMRMRDSITVNEIKALVELIDLLPDGENALHGAFNLQNTMCQGQNFVILDMDNACRGNVIFDFVSTWMALCKISDSALMAHTGMNAVNRNVFWCRFLSRYFETDNKMIIEKINRQLELVGKLRYALLPGASPNMSKSNVEYFVQMIRNEIVPNRESLAQEIKNISI